MTPLRFKYSALFQSVDIVIDEVAGSAGRQVQCRAQLKLPMLSKTYVTSTQYVGEEWESHSPPVEEGKPTPRVERSQLAAEALDPISFFLQLDQGGWDQPKVTLVVGARVIVLDVVRLADGYEIRRPDKDQKLIVRRNSSGISALEVPVPVLGTLSVRRVR